MHTYNVVNFLENILNYFIYFAVITGLIEFTELNHFFLPSNLFIRILEFGEEEYYCS